MRKLLIVAGIAVAGALAVPAVAGAHVTVTPGEVEAGGFEVFTLQVPTEGNSPTRRVVLNIPFGVAFSSYQPVPGWRVSLLRTRSGRVYKVVLNGRLGVGRFQRFLFAAGLPETPQTLKWGATQTYANGRVVRWTDSDPDADTPASTTVVHAATGAAGH
jgi:uncharacterized protein YcnI